MDLPHNERGMTSLLARRLTAAFGIPAEDAHAIVYDVRLALLDAPGIRDTRGWMAGAADEAARDYWRRELPADATAEETSARDAIAFTGPALAPLAPRHREALRLRCHEGRTYEEIAAELSVTAAYARHMVAKALARLARGARE